MTERRLFIFALMLFAFAGTNPSFGQGNHIDSLKQALDHPLPNEEKAEILLRLGQLTARYERDTAISYYQEALKYIQDPFRRGTILDTIGLKYWQKGHLPEAIEFFTQSLSLFEELKDSLWLGKVNNNIAVMNWAMGNGNIALNYYQESLKIRRALNDKKGVSTVLNNIGIIYLDWGLADEAYVRHREALDIALEIDDASSIAYSYTNLGHYYKYLKKYDESIKHYKIGFATEVTRGSIDKGSLAFLLGNIGLGFRDEGSLDSAQYYFQSALYYAHSNNGKNRIANVEYELGRTYLMMNSLDSARKYINRSYRISLEQNYTTLIKDNQFVLAELDAQSGNFQSAFRHLKEATILKDSIFNRDKLLKFNELQIQYNLQQEEAQNALLRKNIQIQDLTIRKQNITRIILTIAIVLVLAFLIIVARSWVRYRDLTKRLQKTEKELRDSNNSKDRFISIMSHDLRSPFISLLGISEILVSEYDTLSAEKVKKYLSILHNTSQSANNLLEELLEWAKAHIGKVHYVPETLNLSELIHGVITLSSQRASEKTIAIDLKVEGEAYVHANRKATDTVIRNLLSNAIKFTEPGGTITIEAEKNREAMRISISDTGIGMNTEQLGNLFKIDSDFKSLGTNNETGHGLGLILCNELIQKQGGSIWAESQLGKGSKFIFTLPLPEKNSKTN